MLAIRNGHTPIIRYLLSQGAHPYRHTKYYDDYWLLRIAAESGSVIAARLMAQFLLRHGADVNAVDMGRVTALSEAVTVLEFQPQATFS